MLPLDADAWISIFMALVTTASAIVTYAVYRSSTDPTVIVFAYADLKRPSIINIKIKNIGKGTAHSVTFTLSKGIPIHAFGIESPIANIGLMNDGPLITGIPFLAPDQEINITWGQYSGIFSQIKGNVLVDSSFYRSKKKFLSKKISSFSILDIVSLRNTESSEYGYGPNIVKQLEKINSNAEALIRAIKRS